MEKNRGSDPHGDEEEEEDCSTCTYETEIVLETGE